MLVRIRFGKGPTLGERRRRTSRMAGAAAAFLSPAALMALVLALWRIFAGFGIAGRFAIPSGFFSYWQTWLAFAASAQLIAVALNRKVRNVAAHPSDILKSETPNASTSALL